MAGISAKRFGVLEHREDNTEALNIALAATAALGKKLSIDAGVYKVKGTINVTAGHIEAAPGTIIEHYPENDSTDLMVITGYDAGRTTIEGLTLRGMQNGHGYGRDLIRVSKGDYVTLRNIYLVSPKRDAFQVRPTASAQWVENMLLENVKIQFPSSFSTTLNAPGLTAGATSFVVGSSAAFPEAPFDIKIDSEIMTVGAINRRTHTFSSVTRGVGGTTAATHSAGATVRSRIGRDGFHFEVQGTYSVSFKPFINQVTMINCETRSVTRHPIMLENTIVGGTTAQKISNFRIINTEIAGAAGPDALFRIKGNSINCPIENITIEDCAIENTEAERTGAGVEITGAASGLFKLENTIVFGTASKVTGYKAFPHWFIRDVGSASFTPVLESHSGLYEILRTATTLPAAGFSDIYTLVAGEILEGYVIERYNDERWYAKFTTFHTTGILTHASNLNVTVSIVAGQLRVTNNLAGTNVYLEVFLNRVIKATAS